MRFSVEDVQRFAAWSADRNLLHLDEQFARQTHFGQPIVHGVLTVLETLGYCASSLASESVRGLDVEFRNAVVVGAEHEARSERDAHDIVLTLNRTGQLMLSVRAEVGPLEDPPQSIELSWMSSVRDRAPREVPAAHAIEEFQRGVEVTGLYDMRVPPQPAAVAAGLSHTQSRVLALCSYVTGMEVPGLASLFTRLTVRFHTGAGHAPKLWYRAETVRFDRTFRILDTALQVVTPDGRLVATAMLRSYVPFSPARPNLDELAERLVPSAERLRATIAVVLGGSRGLGADISAALALAGCQVYASARHDDDARRELHRSLTDRGGPIEFLQGDAGDLAWCESTLQTIQARHGRIDILVLSACAPPAQLRFGPRSADRREQYVHENLRLVETPLAAFGAALDESGGAIVYISSSFVQDTPAGFAHYVAVKQAAEAMVRTISRESVHVSSLIARPPVLQTRWNDTPTGVVGTIPADWAASHIVNRLAETWRPGAHEVLTAFPPFQSSQPQDAKPATPPEFAIRIAASFTPDPLLPGLTFWLDQLELGARVDVAPYGQMLQSLLDPGSLLNARSRGINVLLLRVRDWLRELPDEQANDIEFIRSYLQKTARDLEAALRAHRAQAASDTLLILCPSLGSLSAAESILTQTEVDIAGSLGDVRGLEVISASGFHGHYAVNEDEVYDPLRDEIAHIPYRDEYLHVLSTIVARHVHRRLTPARKVVVVDCDNTLWRGVVGELGAEGVEFDDGHLVLHRTLERLALSGVLVCLCSKNDEADVWRVFETREEMLLGRDTVIAAMINWLPKSQNIQRLATRLNLGLDSFVFIDDNPVECAEVRAGCPDVLTIEWPHDQKRAERLLQHIWELDTAKTTKEDERRTELYKQEFSRQELRAATLTFKDFIDTLDLVVDVAPLAPEDLRRAAQLTLRTNQFNFTTIRRDEADVQALVAGGRHEISTVRVRDRFGDYGLVGLLIVERGGQVWTVDTFLLSCRVLGRGVEHRVVSDLGKIAALAGAGAVRLRLETTRRNTPARSFLESIVPAALLRGDARALECEVPTAMLAAVRFEPATAGEVVVQNESGSESITQHPLDANRLRRREHQIARAAFELATGAALGAAVTGRPLPAAHETGATVEDIVAVVHGAFAAALRLPVEQVAEVDRLEALGCDSLRIVEITVSLTEKFPWLPSTLLFEHRSVSQIVGEIVRLAKPEVAPAAVLPDEAPSIAREHAVGHVDVEEIAVVGMHVRCAGANSPDELWDMLSAGGSAVKEVPADRPYFFQPLSDSRSHWAGLLDHAGQFDAEFFGVSPREAEFMDPQLRLFLEVAWSALEDAGCAGADHDADTGVFAGIMYGDYGFRANLGSNGTANPYRCWESFSLANRLSQLLGFHGPSLAVDTACSSSGTALHLACQALKAGECRVAVVGGVNLILDPDRFASLGRLGILSPRGQCEPFGADADGTVLGEGAGVVVLRPSIEAIRRGDRIYGVIKATALSTGSGTVGFTAPNPQAQAEAIRRAVRTAGVDARTISYVETHGTGTALGDPIEVRGLTLAYGSADLHDPALTLTERCTIGSLKPNIGHLEAGAGVLGLIKVLLQLQRGMRLPSITSPEPNPQIPFTEGAFDVQRELGEWPRPVGQINGGSVVLPRRAGLSSFGVGGANAHVIVEEAPERVAATDPRDRPLHLLALSARGKQALQRQSLGIREYLEAHPDDRLADVCHSVNAGRVHFGHRLALLAANREDVLQALRDVSDGAEPRLGAGGDAASRAAPKVAFLFTGQGSQYPGMGRHLYDTQPVFRHELDRCAAILDTLLNRRLVDLLFASDGTPDAELLHQTGYTQPALFAFEYALSRLWQSWGVGPDMVLGHSVGEIAAMSVAGGVTLEDGLKLVAARGRLMQALPAGGMMTSVMADETRVLAAIAGSVDQVAIAAVNAPGQVVISGAGAAVAEIAARLTADGIKTKALTVSHAFHSPLMRPMLAEYERVVREITFSPPRVPFVSGADGTLVTREVTRPEYWVRQVMEPVRFASGMRSLDAQKVTAYIEIGPHPVLLAMGRQCLTHEDEVAWLPSLRKDADDWQTLLGSVADLYARGGVIDWRAFDAPYRRRRVSAPTYAFTQKEYWLKQVPVLEPAQHTAPSTDTVRGNAAELYELAWHEQAGGESLTAPESIHCVIFADQRGVGSELAAKLDREGARATLVVPGDRFAATGARRYQLDPSRPENYEELWNAVRAQDPEATHRAVHMWSLDAPLADALSAATLDRAVALGVTSAVHLVQALAKARIFQPSVWIITSGAVAAFASARQPIAVAGAPVWGLGRTFALEHPELWGGLIDVSHTSASQAAEALRRELMTAATEDQVALTDNGRYVARLVRSVQNQSGTVRLSPEGTYLITGGVGALGLHAARWLVARGARRLVLTSRRAAVDAGIRARIAALEKLGAVVSLVPGDLSRAADVDALVAGIQAGPSKLRGIVHAAGVDAPMPTSELTAAHIRDTFEGKVTGAWLLHERTRTLDLDLFVCFSSVASVLGSQARAHYAAANAFLDALMVERRRLGLAASGINWGPWKGAGMATAQSLQQFERIGNRGLDPQDALGALGRAIAGRNVQAVVADIDWDKFSPVYEARRVRPIISELQTRDPSAEKAQKQETTAPWIDHLRALPGPQREGELAGLLRREIAETMGFDDPASVPVDRSFYEIGADSLIMADLVSRLKKRVGISCNAAVFNHPTVSSLAGQLLQHLPLEDTAPFPDQMTVASTEKPGYDTGAAPEIFAFQEKAFPERRVDLIAPRWQWMFVDSARRLGVEPRAWFHRDMGRIVGQMGSIPVRLKLGNEEHYTGWLVETFVLEEYRTYAIGSRLMVDAHEDQPFSLSLGQTAEMREIQFRLGWKQVAPLQVAQFLVRPGTVLKGKLPAPAAWAADLGLRASSVVRDFLGERSQFDVRPIERFGDRHDHLWANACLDLSCTVVRDASYLNWKYVDQPGQQFLRLDVTGADSLRGVVVWMFREPDRHYRYRRAFLVDLVAPLSDVPALEQIIKAACGAVAGQDVDSLLCHHIDNRLTQALRGCGFHLRQPERFLLVDPGPLSGQSRDRVLSPESWFVTQGDSDIDRPW